MFGKGKGSNREAQQARADEQARQANIREGTGRVEGIFGQNFTPEFFESRRKAYLGYARPQLDEQYGKTQKELTFSLARSGLLDSSVRGQKTAELQTLQDRRAREIADQALGQETEARNSIEAARGDLIRTLNATGDASGAANSAVTRAQALSAPAPYSPLGQLFADFSAGLGTQAAMERAYAYGGPKPKYNTGLFGTGRGAVAVT